MTSIDETAHTMFGMGRMNPMTLLQTMREIKSILDIFKRKADEAADSVESFFNFTGQHTDIAAVSETGSLQANVIESIPDETVRKNTISAYTDALNDGYLEYNSRTRTFMLTTKGQEHINSDEFIRQFEKDQLGNIAENKARIELKGNPSDLNAFRFTNAIDLNHLAHSSPEVYKRVQEYFHECEKYGFVEISPAGIATPTDKCHDFLNHSPMNDFNIRKVTRDNIRQVADELKDSAKESAKDAFGNILNKAEGGVSAAKETVSYISGSSSGADLAKEGAKFAAQQTARKAQQQAAKQAAKKAAQKAAAKAAASTTAKTAVSSTGYGAAAVAVVELTSKGANALTKMETQAHKATIHYGK